MGNARWQATETRAFLSGGKLWRSEAAAFELGSETGIGPPSIPEANSQKQTQCVWENLPRDSTAWKSDYPTSAVPGLHLYDYRAYQALASVLASVPIENCLTVGVQSTDLGTTWEQLVPNSG